MEALQARPGPALLRARLLGASEITIGDRLLGARDWPGRKARSLLVLLLVAHGRQLHREQALDLLWPDLDPDAGANALYKALHALRRVLEPDLRSGRASAYIDARGETIGLASTVAAWIDVDHFSRLLVQADADSSDERRAHLRQALALYRGEFVADEPYADWPISRREALRADFERGTLQLARLDLEAGEPLAAVPFLEALLAQDATVETAHRALMQAYVASGQRTLALRQYERCRDLLQREYDDEPEPETTRLAESIRVAEAPVEVDVRQLAAMARYGTLPAIPTRTVGRSREIADVRALIADPAVRMVTITGAGGIGKTRLAIEAASGLKEVFPDGIAFAPLAAIRDPGLLFPAIGAALRIPESPSRPMQELVTDHLQARTSLLVLDNLEQLTAAGRAIAGLLETCPGLRILATSRSALRIRAERLYKLGVLALPEAGAASEQALAGVDSTALFLQSLTAIHHEPDLPPADLAAIADICVRLDGLPLAIELAAARCHELTPRQVSAQLAQRARIVVLSDGPQDLPDRHQTLRDLVLWSYDLLPEPDQRLFRQLAVFAGGVEEDALVAVGGEDALARANALADHNLVQWMYVGGVRRLLMLETIREVAAELLAESGDESALRQAHLRVYVDLATRIAPDLKGANQVAQLDRLGRDIDNLRAALGWAQATGDGEPALEILAGTALFWFYRGHSQEGATWLESALTQPATALTPARAAAAVWAGTAANRRRDEERRQHFEDMARELWAELDDPAGTASVLVLASTRLVHDGQIVEALAMLQEALDLYRGAGDAWGIVDTLMEISSMQQLLGQFDDALAGLDEALALARTSSDLLSQSFALTYFASAAVNGGRQDLATEASVEGERIARLVDNRRALPWALFGQAGAAFFDGDYDRTVALLRQVIEQFAELGDRRNLAVAQVSLAAGLARLGSLAEAGLQLCAAIPLIRESGNTEDRFSTITEVAHFALATGQERAAVELFAASAAHARESNEQLPVPDQERFDAAVGRLRSRLPEPAFAAAWSRGDRLELDGALDVAGSVARDAGSQDLAEAIA